MAASCVLPAASQTCVERLRRRLPAQLLEDPPVRIHHREKRRLFPTFARLEQELPSPLLGFKVLARSRPNLPVSLPYRYWASLGAAGAKGYSRSRGKERNDCFAIFFADFGTIGPVVSLLLLEPL